MLNKIYTTDWFNRDSSCTYSKASENTWVSEGNVYSSFLFKPFEVVKMMKDPTVLANELAILKNRFNLFSIHLMLSEGDDSYTDCEHKIVIGNGLTKVVSDQYKALDIIFGLTLHEISHCLYTLMEHLHKTHIKHHIQNVLEDEMIETRLSKKYPGYANFFRQTKYHFFDTLAKDTMSDKSKSDLEAILKIFLFTIRYPKYLSLIPEDELNKFVFLFEKIKKIVDRMNAMCEGNGVISRATKEATDKIVELIKDYIDDEEQDESENGLGNSESENEKSFSEQLDDFNESDLLKALDAMCAHSTEDDEDANDNSGNNLTNSDNETDDKQYSDIIVDILMPETQPTDEYDAKVEKYSNRGQGLRDRDLVNCVYNTSSIRAQQFFTGSKSIIAEFNKISVNRRATTTQLVENRFMRNGNLDSRLLASAIQGVPNVYTQRFYQNSERVKSKFALVISLDESGSVSEQLANMFVSYTAAFIQTFKNNPNVELYIYGHGDKVIAYGAKNVINLEKLCSKYRGQYGQNESSSYRVIIEDVKRQTNLPIVFVNFTDSGYCDSERNIKNLVHEYSKTVSFNLVAILSRTASQSDIDFVNRVNSEIYGEGNYVTGRFSTQPEKNLAKEIVKLINHNYKMFIKK